MRWKSTPSPGKGKASEKSGKGTKGGQKGKECRSGKAYGETTTVGEVELLRQVHTLFVRSAQQVQVVYELQVREEEEGMRQEVREVKGGEQRRKESLTSWKHVEDMDDKHKTHDLSHGEWARDVTLSWETRRNETKRTHTQVFMLSMWKSVIMVMSSLVYASCTVNTQSCPPLLVPISTCSQFQLVVKLYELIVTLPCSHFLHTLHRENMSFEVLCLQQQNTRASRVSVENADSTDIKLLIVGTSSRPHLKAKVRPQRSRDPKWQISVKGDGSKTSRRNLDTKHVCTAIKFCLK